ncbi:DEAD box ATP-dependent RNA helicase, putative [Pediculus humanus corporis]|uniref:ATP-dependent RNA helicase DDX42 n=1 Tax=Pediculus humanus subsp. corporis TaxID=121224 RepID=E0VVS8_PEDHC|nr:DEAD box ATP-dependent RNA helicase, putative [Pediculus humanus corporis]EEB17484.1 DEAD box ATP-dependent RNA helicase, putative [Pediculus humanus corporis]
MSHKRGGTGIIPGFSYSGFVLPKNDSPHAGAAIPPPTVGFKSTGTGLSKQGYSTMMAISQNALSCQTNWGAPKKRAKTEDEYFDEEEEFTYQNNTLEYIPAPGSPSYLEEKNATTRKVDDDDSEEDPLDAFMEGIDQQFQKDLKKAERNAEMNEKGDNNKGFRDDIDAEDDEESYYRYMEENPLAGVQNEDSDIELEYDEDGNPIPPAKNKDIDPLPPIDHSCIEYQDFEKNFYVVHDDVANLSKSKVEELRKTLGIKVTGPQPPHPVVGFAYFGFDEALMKVIRKSEYTTPTPIQAQAVPAALSGRDIIGIAKTGSGKTAAFVWPMLIHIMDQKELKPGDGPIGLILAPTRELSQQIYSEAKKFGKVYNIQVICCYGGGSKWEQSKALENGAEIVVATPGRMIDLIKMKATNLKRVTFLVLDEADRMFDMGFEPQVRSICNHVRPDRQTLLFSATFKKKVERLARVVLTDPIRIVQGDVGEANEDVIQNVLILPNQAAKFMWLTSHIVEFLSNGSLLIFVTKKVNAEEVANNLKLKEFDVLLLHGDMDQIERNKVITQFKKKEVSILVATDVAARGLDIPHIKTVVNYDIARDIDTHTHRIGRTGRAGERGYAYTLVLNQDKEFAGHLVRNLEGANQEVPKSLMDLALQSSWFRKSRFKSGKGKQLNVGGCGLGFRERPGMGSSVSTTTADLIKKCGPGSDRLSAIKATFKSQYLTQFKASSDHTWEHTRNQFDKNVPKNVENTEEDNNKPKRSRKSRWDSS